MSAMDTHALVRGLLDPDTTFATALIGAIHEHGAEVVVDAICATIQMSRANAAAVLLDAVQGEGDEEVEEELRRIAGAN